MISYGRDVTDQKQVKTAIRHKLSVEKIMKLMRIMVFVNSLFLRYKAVQNCQKVVFLISSSPLVDGG